MLEDVVEKEEPLAPLSWVKFCPGQSDDLNKVLEDCGWYYEDLGLEESEKLLQDRPVGHWLLKDCKFDDRYCFTLCIKTIQEVRYVQMAKVRGTYVLDPSIRIHADEPIFECPVAMLEYYCNYTKRLDEKSRKIAEISSNMYNLELYFTKPVLKRVHSLSHLARLVVNKNYGWLKRRMKCLPWVMTRYLEEYPYTV